MRYVGRPIPRTGLLTVLRGVVYLHFIRIFVGSMILFTSANTLVETIAEEEREKRQRRGREREREVSRFFVQRPSPPLDLD